VLPASSSGRAKTKQMARTLHPEKDATSLVQLISDPSLQHSSTDKQRSCRRNDHHIDYPQNVLPDS
jgi:hypothetical protein